MRIPRGGRLLACLTTIVVVVGATQLSAAAATTPRSSSIGGQVVTSPRDAPWSVLILAEEGSGFGECSGSIVDSAHVVTAAHCAYDGQKRPRALGSYSVIAGIAEASADGDHDEEQVREVSSVRVQPGYVPSGIGGDVAILRVEPPFDLSAAAVAAIAVVGEAAGPAAGATARLFGWGQVEDGRLDGRLRRLDQGLLEQWRCTHGVPSVLCAWTDAGAACPGDSGGGLVTATSPPTLLGVSSLVIFPASACAAGNLTVYTDLSTPETHSWIGGDESPPQGPRTDLNALLWGELVSGGAAICNAPRWAGDPVIGTTFLYTTPGSYATQVVQRGASNRYELGPEDVGHSLVCVSVASNAGGKTESASWRPILVGGRASELIGVSDVDRRGRRWGVRLRAAPSLRGERLRAKWTGPSCLACPASHPFTIEKRTRLVSPLYSGRRARLTLRLPALTVGAIPYRGSTLRIRLGVPSKRAAGRHRQRNPLGLARVREATPLFRHLGQVRRPSLLEGAEGAR